MEKAFTEVIAILRSGGVIVYPTETVYGLGGNALDEKAVKKVFDIKSREKDKPLIVLVRDLAMADQLANLGNYKQLLKGYWPGALTGIFRAKKKFLIGIISENGKIALRISSHPFVMNLFKLIDFPLISTSANRSGGESCLDVGQVKKSLGERYKLVDFVFDGGKIPSSLPSTLVDFTVTPPKVLRQGNVIYSPYANYRSLTS